MGDERSASISAADLAPLGDGVRIRYGGTGQVAKLLCGAFLLHESDQAMLAALPQVIRVPRDHAARWLAPYIDALTNEAEASHAGAGIVMARLSDALVARALRHHAESLEAKGWMRGLGDPHLGKALAAIHGEYGRQWTLTDLARASGLSRAAFAARFTSTIGQPAMKYLFGVRMRHATRMLARGNASQAQIAAAVGYGSEAAFFQRLQATDGAGPGRLSSGRGAPHRLTTGRVADARG